MLSLKELQLRRYHDICNCHRWRLATAMPRASLDYSHLLIQQPYEAGAGESSLQMKEGLPCGRSRFNVRLKKKFFFNEILMEK